MTKVLRTSIGRVLQEHVLFIPFIELSRTVYFDASRVTNIAENYINLIIVFVSFLIFVHFFDVVTA